MVHSVNRYQAFPTNRRGGGGNKVETLRSQWQSIVIHVIINPLISAAARGPKEAYFSRDP